MLPKIIVNWAKPRATRAVVNRHTHDCRRAVVWACNASVVNTEMIYAALNARLVIVPKEPRQACTSIDCCAACRRLAVCWACMSLVLARAVCIRCAGNTGVFCVFFKACCARAVQQQSGSKQGRHVRRTGGTVVLVSSDLVLSTLTSCTCVFSVSSVASVALAVLQNRALAVRAAVDGTGCAC